MDFEGAFGRWLQSQRKNLDLTREALATRALCSPSAIKRIETGDLKPSQELAALLARALSIPHERQEAFVRFARTGDEAVYLATVSPPAAATPEREAGNLPRPLTRLVGRERDVAAVRDLLAAADTRLVTLIGPPGVGKTRLALAAGHASIDAFPDGVCFVPLDDLSDATHVPGAILRALGARAQPSQTVLAALSAAVRGRRLLLVIDNFEHVLQAAPRITRLLAEAEHVKALVTSRELLNVYGEHAFPVQPLRSELGTEARTLFADRARAVLPGFRIGDDNSRLVERICARLDGIPLAIEMAAAQMRRMSLEQLDARLGDQLIAFATGHRDVPDRQRSLRAMLDWSVALLSPDERRVFDLMSVFAGGATVEALTALCADTELPGFRGLADGIEESVTTLAEKNLIIADPDSGRSATFAVMRQFGREQLAARGCLEAALSAHARYYAGFAQRLRSAADRDGEGQRRYVAGLARDHDNLYAAFDWAIVHEPITALRLATSTGSYQYQTGAWSDNRRWLVSALERAPADADPALRAHALAKASFICDRLDDAAAALRYNGEARALAEAAGNLHALADSLRYAANMALKQQRYAEGISCAERAVGMAESLGLTADAATARTILGELRLARNEFKAADQVLESVLQTRRALGDWRGEAQVLTFLGSSAYQQADYPRARALLAEALDRQRESGDLVNQTVALEALGTVERNGGRYAEAETAFRESMALARRLGNLDAYCAALDSQAALSYLLGRHDVARSEFEECLRLSASLGNWRRACFCLEGLAMVAVAAGQLDRAATLFGAAEAARARLQAPLPPSESGVYGRAVADLTASWPDAGARERAWRAGAGLSIAEAIAVALG